MNAGTMMSTKLIERLNASEDGGGRKVTVKLGADVIPILHRYRGRDGAGNGKRESLGDIATKLITAANELLEAKQQEQQGVQSNNL